MGSPQSLVGEHIVVLPAPLGGAVRQLLMNPDQVVEDLFHAVAPRVGAVILVIDARITLGWCPYSIAAFSAY
jgi:hypothetical protein